MTERIENAINVLLDAYNNRTLASRNYHACAVGNLVAHAMGKEIKTTYPLEMGEGSYWYSTICDRRGRLGSQQYTGRGNKELELLDFTLDEIDIIEQLFEGNTSLQAKYYRHYTDHQIRKDQLSGLKAVVEYLLTLDETEENESYEKVFLNRCEVIPS